MTYGKNHIVGFNGEFGVVFYIAYGFNSAVFGIIAAEFCSEYYLSAKRIISFLMFFTVSDNLSVPMCGFASYMISSGAP